MEPQEKASLIKRICVYVLLFRVYTVAELIYIGVREEIVTVFVAMEAITRNDYCNSK